MGVWVVGAAAGASVSILSGAAMVLWSGAVLGCVVGRQEKG